MVHTRPLSSRETGAGELRVLVSWSFSVRGSCLKKQAKTYMENVC